MYVEIAFQGRMELVAQSYHSSLSMNEQSRQGITNRPSPIDLGGEER